MTPFMKYFIGFLVLVFSVSYCSTAYSTECYIEAGFGWHSNQHDDYQTTQSTVGLIEMGCDWNSWLSTKALHLSDPHISKDTGANIILPLNVSWRVKF